MVADFGKEADAFILRIKLSKNIHAELPDPKMKTLHSLGTTYQAKSHTPEDPNPTYINLH